MLSRGDEQIMIKDNLRSDILNIIFQYTYPEETMVFCSALLRKPSKERALTLISGYSQTGASR